MAKRKAEKTKTSRPSRAPVDPLDVGHELSHEDRTFRVVQVESQGAGECRYRVEDVTTNEAPLWMRQRRKPAEGKGDPFAAEVDCLERIHKERRVHLLPLVVAHFEHEDSAILILDRLFAPELRQQWEALADHKTLALCFEQVLLSISKVHQAGFVLTNVRDTSFARDDEGKVQLVDLSRVTRRGSAVQNHEITPFSPPEMSKDPTVDERTDIYAVGALFMCAFLQVKVEDSNLSDLVREEALLEPVVSQIVRGAIVERELRFLSVDEMRVLLYQLKNEQARFPRPSAAMSSTVGISQHRYINEDSAGFNELGVQYQSRPQHLGFYCVADGMGGHELGERASQLAVLGALQAFRQLTQEVPFDRLQYAMAGFALAIGRAASEVVCSGAEHFEGGSRMGTTFTGILVINDELAVSHVGDSRALLIRDGAVEPLTVDHSLVASLVRVGQMTEEEAAVSDERNVLVRCIDARVPMDEAGFDSLAAVGHEHGRIPVKLGDIVLILSDGVWGVLPDDQLLDCIKMGGGPQVICDRIVRRALEAASDDNATVMAVAWE